LRKKLEAEEAALVITAPTVKSKGRYADNPEDLVSVEVGAGLETTHRGLARPMGDREFEQELRKPWKRED